jgi:hypothetical protein
MAEPFSVNDVYYTNCNDNACSSEEQQYKNNVDELIKMQNAADTSIKQRQDITEEQSALMMSNIGLGVGILAMLWVMKSN